MIGEQLGTWTLIRELGRGGMGEVYLAQEEMSGRLAAVKLLAPELAREGAFLRRFQQEVEALRKLDHPNIVKFIDAGFEKGVHYYVMEYVEGESLERVLRRRKRLPWQEVLDIALQVSRALKHAHDMGIIHRDLKPSNLIQTDDGTIKLTDFGIAKVFAGGHFTKTGNIVGTIEYISPEQASGKSVTKRSDLYSLGVVLYVLLTGRPPFVGKGAISVLHQHRYGQFDPPIQYVPELPQRFNDLICSLLEKDPAKRPPDCLVLRRQLERIEQKAEELSAPTRQIALDEATLSDKPDQQMTGKHKEGPATLMSRLIREELESGQPRSPWSRLLNHPLVIVLALVLCIAGLVYAFLPPSAETLFRRGEALMKTGKLSDMETAFRDYFDPLERRFPDHPYREQIDEYRKLLDEKQAEAAIAVGDLVETLFDTGLAAEEAGNVTAARKRFSAIVTSFADKPGYKQWVARAKERLALLDRAEADPDRWKSARLMAAKAAVLHKTGKAELASELCRTLEEIHGSRIWQILLRHFADDPDVRYAVELTTRGRR